MERIVANITRTLIKRLPAVIRRGICSGVYYRMGQNDWVYDDIPKERDHLWIVAAPKSGSTWVSVVLDEALGYRKLPLTKTFERQEQQVDANLMLIPGVGENIFSPHQHCRYSAFTGDFITRGNVRVLLTVRNIFDTLMSLHDHCNHEYLFWSMCYADSQLWRSLKTKDNRLRFLADTAIPWYANFYAGWLSNLAHHSDQIAICRYEHLIEDPGSLLLQHLRAIGIAVSEEAISRGLTVAKKQYTRKNKAVAGRCQNIPDDVREQVTRIFHHYKDIDWSFIGIPSQAADSEVRSAA